MRRLEVIFLFIVMFATKQIYAEKLTLADALAKAINSHPSLTAARAMVEMETSMIKAKEWPMDPMFGVMHERNMNLMQQAMGPMTSLGFMQEVEFPLKYVYRGRIQEKKALLAREEVNSETLSLRSSVISAYYKLFAAKKIKSLLEAQKATLQNMARIAESRHAIGAVSQQDEMKAHVEQTATENELYSVKKEEEALKVSFASLLFDNVQTEIELQDQDLLPPKFISPENIHEHLLENAIGLKKDRIRIEESRLETTLTLYDYAPDFRIGARMMVGESAPSGNFAVTVDLSVPLWFFQKQSSEVEAAKARERKEKNQFESTRRALLAKTQAIISEIKTHERLMKVYDTTLIPQATSSFNSSQAAYQAGKGTFLDLLESERTVYMVKASYYRHLAQFVEQIVLLEELLGESVSSLPFGELS